MAALSRELGASERASDSYRDRVYCRLTRHKADPDMRPARRPTRGLSTGNDRRRAPATQQQQQQQQRLYWQPAHAAT